VKHAPSVFKTRRAPSGSLILPSWLLLSHASVSKSDDCDLYRDGALRENKPACGMKLLRRRFGFVLAGFFGRGGLGDGWSPRARAGAHRGSLP
jgi:hypothetical protein